MIVTLSGKGGVGKTSLTALILDEVIRRGHPGKILVVDGDPAMTLHLALGVDPPPATLADVRENTPLDAKTLRSLPTGMSRADYVRQKLSSSNAIVTRQLHGGSFDLLAMGQQEGAGCYCAINSALSQVLKSIMDGYSLILIDNEAGVEHLSRQRLNRVDHFLVVATPTRAAQDVAQRVVATAWQSSITIGEVWQVLNQVPWNFHRSTWGRTCDKKPRKNNTTILVSRDDAIADLEMNERPVIDLDANHLIRHNLRRLVERLCV